MARQQCEAPTCEERVTTTVEGDTPGTTIRLCSECALAFPICQGEPISCSNRANATHMGRNGRPIRYCADHWSMQ